MLLQFRTYLVGTSTVVGPVLDGHSHVPSVHVAVDPEAVAPTVVVRAPATPVVADDSRFEHTSYRHNQCFSLRRP